MCNGQGSRMPILRVCFMPKDVMRACPETFLRILSFNFEGGSSGPLVLFPTEIWHNASAVPLIFHCMWNLTIFTIECDRLERLKRGAKLATVGDEEK